ncbi:hypothetical protein KA001_01430, partial [Patescibacteria group bacterium]|nr:hypothetical protein [Patescibacteria group bacterium]
MKPSKLIKVIAKDLAFLGGEMSAEIKGFSLGTRLDIEAFSKANKSFRRIFDLDKVRVEKGNVQEYKAESSIIYGGMPAIYGIKTLKKDFGVQEITATVCYFDEGQDSPLEDIVLLSDGTSISTKTPLKCSTFAHNYT